MSLLSTIAHDSPFPPTGLRSKRMAIIVIAVGVAVAIAIALSVSFRPNVTDSAMGTTTGQLTHADFMELNTVALAALEPAKAAVADNSFLYWNTESIEYRSPIDGLPATGPR